jgi:hypothetical protein
LDQKARNVNGHGVDGGLVIRRRWRLIDQRIASWFSGMNAAAAVTVQVKGEIPRRE